jgi:hypothetical protein
MEVDHMTGRRDRERGVALFAVAIFMLVILGFTAVGIDVARLAHIATEVQSVADTAATAGALELAKSSAGPNANIGITAAKLIGHKNTMNGTLAPNANIVADEGHFDGETSTFECCTQNSSCCNGGGAWGDPSSGGVNCVGAAGADCTRRDAVLALPSTPVQNIFAGIFDAWAANADTGPNHTTTVEKLAVASASGPANGCKAPEGCAPSDWQCFCANGKAPCLPIAAPNCQFPNPCFQGSCQLPAFTMGGPSVDTAVWQGFQTGHSTSDVRGFLVQGSCRPNGQGSYTVPGDQSVFGSNDWVDTTNGVTGNGLNNPFNLTKCIYDNHMGCNADAQGNISAGTAADGRVFTIPIFDWATCSSTAQGQQDIVGFATVRITSVTATGGSGNTVRIQTISHTSSNLPSPGGGCFGSDCRVVLGK